MAEKTYEIGKLLNGKPDPCFTCKNSDSLECLNCDNYQNFKEVS